MFDPASEISNDNFNYINSDEANMEDGSLARAIYRFSSDVDGELSLNVGEIVQIQHPVDRYWYFGTNGFQSGNFPAGFVVEVELPPVEENQELFVTFEGFPATVAGDLGFDKNNIIVGISQVDSSWWLGELNGNRGIFPITHVWKVDVTIMKRKKLSQSVQMKARVKMDMKAQLEEEIDLVKGELVLVTEVIDKDWMRGVVNGRSGIFPSSYVEIQSTENFVDNLITSEPPQQNSLEPIPGYHCGNSGITPYGRSRYSFVAQYPDELCFHAGELINITRHVDSQWLEGELGGKRGFFPKSHIEIIVDCARNDTNVKVASISENEGEIIPGVTEARVLYDYIAERPGDLNLVEDEIITICKRLNNEWYEAKDSQGTIGLCPANYVIITPTKKTHSTEECNNNKPVQVTYQNSISLLSKPVERRLDFSKPRCASDTNALEKSIAKNLANLDLSLNSSPRPKSASFATQKQAQEKFPYFVKPISSTPPPRPLPPNFSNKTLAVLPPRPPPPDVPKHEEPPELPPPMIPLRTYEEEKTLVPFRAAPAPPPVGHLRTNEAVSMVAFETDTSLRVPHRRAPPPPARVNSKDNMEFSELQRRITERENILKQLKNAKQELDSHVISRQSSQEAMKENVRAYEETIDGLTNEITNLKDSAKTSASQNNCQDPSELRLKNLEKRKKVIEELINTEQDYVMELKLCWDIFLKNSQEAKSRGIDTEVLFGNFDQIIKIGDQLLSSLKTNSAHTNDDRILIGECFQLIAVDMKDAYGIYCSGHDDVLHLLEKYQENESIQNFINRKINVMREKTPCFSLGSILIKPVQRILKYPLLLNELIKVTENEHPDKVQLQKAIQIMTDMATSINDKKRRRDLAVKYRKDSDTSFSAMISKINIHSVVKKSNRIGMRLSSTIGLTSITKDETFDEEEHKFRALDKTIKSFIKDVTEFCILLEEWVNGQFHGAEALASTYADQCKLTHIDQYRTAQRELFTLVWKDFKNIVANNVVNPLNDLLALFQGPAKVIDKRYDKLLDYDRSTMTMEKNKDISKGKQLSEEHSRNKCDYEALNAQLLEELPKFFTLSLGIFFDCVVHFFIARKKFIGKLSEKMFSLMDLPAFCSSRGDILDDFEGKHAHVASELTTFNFIPKNFFLQRMDSLRDKKGKLSANKENIATNNKQSDSNREKVTIQYSPPDCYCAIKLHQPSDKYEIPLTIGDIVGVIKQHDPMGGTNRWFVDNGAAKGFVPADCLVPTAGHSREKSKSFSEHGQSRTSGADVKMPLDQIPVTKHRAMSVNLPPEPPEIQVEDPPPSYYDLPPDDVVDQRYDLPFDDLEDLSEAEEVYVAAYDLHASVPGTLTLSRGQCVFVTQKHDMEGNSEWWYCKTISGEKGYVPANYLIKS